MAGKKKARRPPAQLEPALTCSLSLALSGGPVIAQAALSLLCNADEPSLARLSVV